jgi:hypothetical protein
MWPERSKRECVPYAQHAGVRACRATHVTRTAPRATIALCLLLGAAACGGSSVAPAAETGTIAIVSTPSSFSGVAGGTASAGLTISRGGGFGGEITLSASGAPSGMTVSFAPATVSPLLSSSSVSASIASTVPPGAYSVIVTGTGTGTQVTGKATLTISVLMALNMQTAR